MCVQCTRTFPINFFLYIDLSHVELLRIHSHLKIQIRIVIR